MAWLPTKQVIDFTQIGTNLLAYIEIEDAGAIEWAHGDVGLSEFQAFYTNASGRLQTIFPSLMILSQDAETDLAGEMLIAGLQLTLEGTVSGPDPDELVANTKKYAQAVESILANIPSATLTANSSPGLTANLIEIETRFDIIRGQQTPSSYLQIFQVRCVYRLTGIAYQAGSGMIDPD